MFSELDQLHETGQAAQIVGRVVASLRDEKAYHKLFDALLLQKRLEMDLPLGKLASFDDVPKEQQPAFEEAYVDAAREVGELFLADGNLRDAWVYFRTIREPEKIRAAIDAIPAADAPREQVEEVIQIALFDGAHPVKGLELLLHSHGTCNTITSLDQQMPQLKPVDRSAAAALLVRSLYDDLRQSVRRDVERKEPNQSEQATLSELVRERPWLFDDGNYHIDVSHLHSVVRFARFLDTGSPELAQAIELADYGSRLAEQFRYPSDPPFAEYYPAHAQFFRVLQGRDRAAALEYFRAQIESQDDERDQAMCAYVLADLLVRVDRLNDAVDVAEKTLRDIEEPNGFSFTDLCRKAGRTDALLKAARERGDVVTYAAALLSQDQPGAGGSSR